MKEFFGKYKLVIFIFLLSLFSFLIYEFVISQPIYFPIELAKKDDVNFFVDNVDVIYKRGYLKKDDKVYYRRIYNENSDSTIERVKGVDLETFKVIVSENKINPYSYAKDKHNVYYSGEKIKNANSKTFTLLCGDYFRDEENVYYAGKNLNVDLETFKIIDCKQDYVADKNYVRRGTCKIGWEDLKLESNLKTYLDPKTFEVLGPLYAKDKNGVYFIDNFPFCAVRKIENADFETFQSLGRYGKDKNNCYYWDEITDMSDCIEASEKNKNHE